MMQNRVVIVHVETGGFSIERNPILEVAMSVVEAVGFATGIRRHYRIAPPRGTLFAPAEGAVIPEGTMVIEKGAAEANGYNEELWAMGPSPAEVDRDLQAMLTMYTPDGQKLPVWAFPAAHVSRWVTKYFPMASRYLGEWRCLKERMTAYLKAQPPRAGRAAELMRPSFKSMAHWSGGVLENPGTARSDVELMRFMLAEIHEPRAEALP